MDRRYHGVMTATTRWPEAHGKIGVIASPHRLASDAGLAVLREDGNAIDAAIAAAATIAVVYPHMNGIGGDSFWLIYDARRRRLLGLNAAGRSAAAATLETYRTRHGREMPARGGGAALTVPGVVSGWWEAHSYSATRMKSPIAWSTLLAHAIGHAREGFVPSAGQHRVTSAALELFGDHAIDGVKTTLWPVYHPERLDTDRFVQRDLARTLTQISDHGAEEFYRGALGRRIVDGAAATGSPLTYEDFVTHRADWAEPITIPYRGGQAASFPPPTQGFAALAILGILEGFDLASLDDADYVHLVVEATKLAFEDRDRYLADPDVVPVPVSECLDPLRLTERRRRISIAAALGLDAPARSGDTIAIVTADGTGNAVSLIQSLYHEFGSGIVAGDTGVLLQNRGAFFSLDPAHPNALAPRKRPGHTLIPSMYLRDGRPRLVYGTMGGEGQPQTQAALVTRVIDRHLSVQAAVEAPRWLFGRTWGEAARGLRLEARFDPNVASSLARRGHDVRTVDQWSDLMGHAQMIALGADGLTAASDPRADGSAAGF